MTVLQELLVRIGVDSSGVDEGVEETTSRLGGLAAPAAAAGLAAGAVFVAGISSAMDISEAQHRLQNQLGLTEVEAERAGGIAGDVFADGFGESIDDVSGALGGVVSAMGDLGDFTDAELQQMTKGALGLADAFELDVADAASAAAGLISNKLVKDGTEAFDVLTKAAQTLPKAMVDDVIATVSEYGKTWSRVGIDAKTAFGMMSQYIKAGGRDIDQAGDVLHEFARITFEETDKAAEAFKGLGLNSKEMLAEIHKGGAPAQAALQKTIEALRGVKDPSKQAALAVELFGDMAGEGADALWAMDPATAAAAAGMDEAAGASKALTDNMEKDPTQQMNKALRTLQMTLGEALLPMVKKASDFFAEHKELIKTLAPIVLVLVAALGVMAAVIWLVNIAMMANPVGLIIAGIIALIAVVVLIIVYWDDLVAVFRDGWDRIQRKFGDGWNWLVRNVFSPIGRFFTETIPRAVGDGVRWVQDKWNGMIDWFASIPGRLAKLGQGMWGFILNGLKGALNSAISLVNQGIWFINDKLISNANRLPGISISYIPYIPYLADGGITTGPTLAMIGEGSEQEAVLPLSKLEALISMPSATAAPSTGRVQPVQVLITPSVNPTAFQDAFQYEVRTKAGSSVARYAGEDD